MTAIEKIIEENKKSNREQLIDIIVSMPVHGIEPSLEEMGVMVFIGNQHNIEWQWDHAALGNVQDAVLVELYYWIKKQIGEHDKTNQNQNYRRI